MKMPAPTPAGRRIGLTSALLVTMLLAGAAVPLRRTVSPATVATPAAGWPATDPSFTRSGPLTAAGPLFEPGLDLRAGPVPLPLELRMPSLQGSAPVVGVGINATGAMDAPMGPPGDPAWQEAFWYRGSAVPGAFSTAVIAGHVDGGGLPAAFAHLDALRPGDPVVVRDVRSGLDVGFEVTGSESIPLDQTTDPAVLSRIYGVGPVGGSHPQVSVDGRSYLTLITCSGTFRNGTHDHRLAVYARRVA